MKKTDIFLFKMLEDVLVDHGMWEVTPEILDKIWKTEGGLEPPMVERVIDVKERVSFIFHLNGYVFWVHTTFNRETKKFSPYAAISIVISKLVDRGSDRILTRFVYRAGNPTTRIKRTIQYVHCIVDELKNNWPINSTGEWAQLKEFKNEQFYWVEGSKKLRNFFKNSSNYHLVHSSEVSRFNYHKTRRKKLGVKQYRRDIRKPYKKTKK